LAIELLFPFSYGTNIEGGILSWIVLLDIFSFWKMIQK
jgi:hypothetical protein